MVIAATGYIGGPMTRWMPAASCIIATETIGKGRVHALFPSQRVVGDSKLVLHYFRPGPDTKRVLFA